MSADQRETPDGLGEVVFNTAMTGYQEIMTDPSYAGSVPVAIRITSPRGSDISVV